MPLHDGRITTTYICDGCGLVIDPKTQDYVREDGIGLKNPGPWLEGKAQRFHFPKCVPAEGSPEAMANAGTYFTHDDPRPEHTEAAGH